MPSRHQPLRTQPPQPLLGALDRPQGARPPQPREDAVRDEATPHFPAAARTQEITRAPGLVSAQRPHRLAKPWRRVTSSNSAAGWRKGLTADELETLECFGQGQRENSQRVRRLPAKKNTSRATTNLTGPSEKKSCRSRGSKNMRMIAVRISASPRTKKSCIRSVSIVDKDSSSKPVTAMTEMDIPLTTAPCKAEAQSPI
jgi:hypothetical protein